MKKATDKIKQAWEENPLAVIAVASGAVIATAKLIDSLTAAKNAQSWKKEVQRRERNARR
jgi:hypoxanthine-guanine phosphoribosyltransferase